MSFQRNQGDSPLKVAATELNQRVDCADLALRLGLPRDGTRGNFENPNEAGRPKTLACYADSGKGSKWKDFRTEDHGGPIDLLMLVQGLDFVAAVKELASMYGVVIGTQARPAVQAPKSTAEFIADNCLRDGRGPRSGEVVDYLAGRGIEPFAIEAALKKGTLGMNLWTSNKVQRGEVNWGGPAAAFVVRSQQSGRGGGGGHALLQGRSSTATSKPRARARNTAMPGRATGAGCAMRTRCTWLRAPSTP
jgi:hypothetical protein